MEAKQKQNEPGLNHMAVSSMINAIRLYLTGIIVAQASSSKRSRVASIIPDQMAKTMKKAKKKAKKTMKKPSGSERMQKTRMKRATKKKQKEIKNVKYFARRAAKKNVLYQAKARTVIATAAYKAEKNAAAARKEAKAAKQESGEARKTADDAKKMATDASADSLTALQANIQFDARLQRVERSVNQIVAIDK